MILLTTCYFLKQLALLLITVNGYIVQAGQTSSAVDVDMTEGLTSRLTDSRTSTHMQTVYVNVSIYRWMFFKVSTTKSVFSLGSNSEMAALNFRGIINQNIIKSDSPQSPTREKANTSNHCNLTGNLSKKHVSQLGTKTFSLPCHHLVLINNNFTSLFSEICSWRPDSRYCYPGRCPDVPGSCSCHPDFSGPSTNCMTSKNMYQSIVKLEKVF